MTGKRLAWIDIARGVGIVLVVFGHAWRNADADRLLGAAEFERVDGAIYLFHMPLFFFLSGLFIAAQVARRGTRGYLASRPVAILLPLFVWSLLTAVLRIVAGQRVPLIDLVLAPFDPRSIFWFLWALLGCQLFATVVIATGRARIAAASGALAAIAAIAVLPVDYDSLLYRLVENLPFYLAGMLIPVASIPTTWRAGFVALAGFVAAEVLNLAATPVIVHYALSLLATAGAIVTVAAVATAAPGTAAAHVLAHLGQKSMAIYLMHLFFLAVHLLLLKFGVTNVPLHLIVATVLGLAGPLLAARIADALGLHVLIGGRL